MMNALRLPDVLGLPLRSGYGVKPQNTIQRTQMESGPSRQREIFTNASTHFPVQWSWNDWQFALFQSWLKHKARNGGAWVLIPLRTGLGVVDHEVQILGRGEQIYDAVLADNGRWQVSVMVEARNSPVLTADALDIVIAEDVDGLITAVDGLSNFVNVVLPSAAGWN
jgi:hypothetical protein